MRLEAYYGSHAAAHKLAKEAAAIYGGATIVYGDGYTQEWGIEQAFIVTVLTDGEYTHVWQAMAKDALRGTDEEAVLVVVNNEAALVYAKTQRPRSKPRSNKLLGLSYVGTVAGFRSLVGMRAEGAKTDPLTVLEYNEKLASMVGK